MISLVRQRQVIERERIIGTLFMGLGGVYALLLVAILLDGAGVGPSLAFNGLMFASFFVVGFRQVRKARRDLAAFEAEHGVGAGVQQPLR
jgi:hypothetical protein